MGDFPHLVDGTCVREVAAACTASAECLSSRGMGQEMLSRFTEDLTALQRAIRWGEGDKLQDLFTRTRAIRRGIIDAKQA